MPQPGPNLLLFGLISHFTPSSNPCFSQIEWVTIINASLPINPCLNLAFLYNVFLVIQLKEIFFSLQVPEYFNSEYLVAYTLFYCATWADVFASSWFIFLNRKMNFPAFFPLMKFIFLRLQTTWKSLVGGTGDKNAYISAGSWVEFTVFWLVVQLLFTEHLWCARHTNVFYNSHQCHLVFIFQMNKLVLRVTCPSSFINEQTEIPILLCLSLKPYRTGLKWK